ncbi:MAG: hypothetical protein U1E40_06065 [Amaricoccus sp.]
MLDDLRDGLGVNKYKDLVKRLNSKKVEQALPAEMELCLSWAANRVANIQVEPDWWPSKKRPDFYAGEFAGCGPCVVEITATADVSFSGEDAMDHCAQVFVNFSNSIRKGSGSFLYFSFYERKTREQGRTVRNIAAPKAYAASEEVKQRFREWLEAGGGRALEISEDGIHVTIEKKSYKQIRYHSYWTSRPPRAYSDTSNSIYDALASKVPQVEDAPPGVRKIIFLADVGSRPLAHIHDSLENNRIEKHSTAKRIIHRFLSDKAGRVDSVVVFSPEQRPLGWQDRREPGWQVTLFCERDDSILLAGIDMLRAQLPAPRFSGAQARSLFRQGAFDPEALGRYLAPRATSNWSSNIMTYRVSARALQEFLSGRIDADQFRRVLGESEDGPSISRFLKSGMTIKSASFEEAGIDQDDDYLVLTFAPDPAASKFR